MSTSQFAILLTLLCGDGDTAANHNCYDYYNNCVVDKSIELRMEDVESCKDGYQEGIVRLLKLKEDK